MAVIPMSTRQWQDHKLGPSPMRSFRWEMVERREVVLAMRRGVVSLERMADAIVRFGEAVQRDLMPVLARFAETFASSPAERQG